MEPHYYHVNLAWTSGRKGIVSSPELEAEKGISFEVATPPQFPKGEAGIWSPEHLFTAAVNSCLMTTFLSIAENSALVFTKFSCKAAGKLDQPEGKLRMTEVMLAPSVTVTSEQDKNKALRILQKAEAACLISNSVNATVRMNPVIEVEESGNGTT